MQNTLILILSILGILITSYISIAHLLNKKVICPVNSKSCNVVLDSKYSKTLGIKNEIIGLVYYLIILLSIFVAFPLFLIKVASSLAALYSTVLLGIQIKVLKNYCSWCITTAIINIILFLLILNF